MTQTATTFYEHMGGEPTVRRLVDRFYDLMDTLPEAYGIRKLHPADLSGSADKLFMYLTGWLGGPQLYVQAHGHPRLRARHLPFPIAGTERDQWLMCMRMAMDEVLPADDSREQLYQALADLADHMRNREG
ncbi:MAG: group II truncated hemoglobin [Gammaproteobacteria bacterium]|jgi:hemoglobin|nr:group II truncated hemoglobin [Gammaproteobacteria bacterium]MBU0773410.1 group II truncated hemoglobin [Gammaproteobacteria bacterium]MBU0857386.1 group II truncated hemoglobin [Gammaproteobacteria bacterium]MBU1846849.1 group II truncated hemoglobin [Gammaproteobacteria bacterium]